MVEQRLCNAEVLGSSPNDSSKIPMAAVAQATHLTHAFHLSLLNAAGGKSLHDGRQLRIQFPRSESLHKRVLHTMSCETGYVSSDKRRQSLALDCLTNKASNPRGYNTGNVPPSYGPEDGNIYGDASHSEAEDESATVSKNMRRVPQNEAPAHGFSGGRAAQGTMSRPPEAAAQSGKVYDQETIEISTNKVR